MMYEKLDYILAIAEERNLTKAAQKLFVSQPTLTVHLNRLESQLGVKLFDRSTSPVTITPAGQFYIEKMKQIADQERAVRSSLQGIANPAQTLNVGIGQVRGRHWLPLILPTFCKMHPDIKIQLFQLPEASIADSLQQGQLDILIGILPSMRSDIEVITLLKEHMFLLASHSFQILTPQERSLGIDTPAIVQPSRLNGLPFIIPSPDLGLYKSYETLLRLNHFQPGRTIAVNDSSTGMHLARKGLGVQLLPGSLMILNPEITSQTLDFFQLPNMPDDRKCSVAFRRDTLKMELIQDFLTIIDQEVIPQCVAITKC